MENATLQELIKLGCLSPVVFAFPVVFISNRELRRSLNQQYQPLKHISGLYVLDHALALFRQKGSLLCTPRSTELGFLGKACKFKSPGQNSISHRVPLFLTVN